MLDHDPNETPQNDSSTETPSDSVDAPTQTPPESGSTDAAPSGNPPADSAPTDAAQTEDAPSDAAPSEDGAPEAAVPAAKKAAAKRAPAKKAAAKRAPAKRASTRKTAAKKTAQPEATTEDGPVTADPLETAPLETDAVETASVEAAPELAPDQQPGLPLFQTPEPVAPEDESAEETEVEPEEGAAVTDLSVETGDQLQDQTDETAEETVDETADGTSDDDNDDDNDGQGGRRRRRRGGRRRRRSGGSGGHDDADSASDSDPASADTGTDSGSDSGSEDGSRDAAQDGADQGAARAEESPNGNARSGSRGGRSGRGRAPAKESDTDQTSSEEDASADGGGESDADQSGSESSSSRRRRRRRRSGDDSGDQHQDDPDNTVTRVRSRRSAEDQITAVSGSTRLEAKKQRRREGREAGRRRAPIVSEAEFLARRESVDRVMVVRQRDDLTQIAVLEDKVLVEHYVSRESQTSLIGNVYLGRVQNVLPSMEAAFVDIGKGRNAVLYAGEVNWSALGHKDGAPRKIESVLSSGQSILVQVSKDPMGHKGARLTSQVSLAGRFLVYVPDGTTSGISRKLPDTERSRLKSLLKEMVPDTAGVIVRTAAEGASEEELVLDVERLTSRWADIEKAAKTGSGPKLLYGEPDLTLKVVRDLFTEDFARLVIEGDGAWDTVQGYVHHVAPDLETRLERFEPEGGRDVFAAHRIDEQIHKGLDRKVWLPSGGSLVIDRTEAMTVVDVNTGKFTGSGGNLEETVTKNNLEAAEEMVRQLRLRDIGGIIVIDFIDMVLESNRDLVLRRLVECLGRDRTRHQVAEVTSLGLVQMTRKRIGTGLLEAFSEPCEACQGRGLVMHEEPVEASDDEDDVSRRGGRRGRATRARDASPLAPAPAGPRHTPTPRDIASTHPHRPDAADDGEAAVSPEPEVAAVPELPVADVLAEVVIDEVPTPVDDSSEAASDDTSADLDLPESGPVEPIEPDLEPLDDDSVGPSEPDGAAGPIEATPDHADAEPGDEDLVPTPAAPRVVTRTRRRSASRPAGPPVVTSAGDSYAGDSHAGESHGGVATLDAPSGHAGGESSAFGEDDEDGTGALSVPVKRRGTRKR